MDHYLGTWLEGVETGRAPRLMKSRHVVYRPVLLTVVPMLLTVVAFSSGLAHGYTDVAHGVRILFRLLLTVYYTLPTVAHGSTDVAHGLVYPSDCCSRFSISLM